MAQLERLLEMSETPQGSPGSQPGKTFGRPGLLLAHRGGLGPWRENTIEAFRGALEQGAHGVELDVRRSRDGALVVHHDAVVEGLGPLHELGSEELPVWIPTLDQALEACAGASVNVEIKNSPRDPDHDPSEAVAFGVLEAISAARRMRPGSLPSSVLISSFSSATIAALVGAGADVPLGLLVEPMRSTVEALFEAWELGCETVNVFHQTVTPELVTQARELGLGTVAWTVNGREQVASMLDAGVEVIISDDVAGALGAIRAAGLTNGPEGGLVRGGSPRGQSKA